MEAATRTTLGELALALGLSAEGPAEFEILGLAGLEDAGPRELSFVTGEKYARSYQASAAGACIVAPDFDVLDRPCLRSPAPYADFARAITLLYPRPRPEPGVHATAVVSEDATLGDGVSIGAYAVVGRGSRIGARTVIHPHVTLYANVTIGEDSEVHAGACLREGTRVGNRVVIENGVVLGSFGFGHTFAADGTRVTIPHHSPVEVGDDAEIGANSTVDAAHPAHERRGYPEARTRIGPGVKIDNLVQVGHGCVIEEGATLCAQTGLGGSTWVGKRVIFGGQAATAGHLHVGDDALVGARGAPAGDVAPQSQVSGTPAIPRRLWARYSVARQYLPELLRRVRRIEQKLGLGDKKPG